MSNGAEMRGCEIEVASLAPIVTVPSPRATVAPAGLLSESVKLSGGSLTASSATGTATVFAVWPGTKVSTPLCAV
jgi:hypothetical protein